MKLRKGDTVKVFIGKDKGKVGKILKMYSKEDKVLVENINQYKRHLKRKSEREQSQIVTLTKPLPLTNVSLVCPKCNKVTRVGYKQSLRSGDLKLEKEKKIRVCKKCGKEIEA